MASRQRDTAGLTPHPIDELFEAVERRVGLPERDKALAERGTLSRDQISAERRREAWRRRQRNVRANRSGEQR